MGIPNLFNYVKFTTKSVVHLDDLKGKTIGVDTSCIIHRSILKCAQKLLTEGKSDMYANEVLRFGTQLRDKGVTPVFIFDGRRYPLKGATDKQRAAKRQQARGQLLTKASQRNNIFTNKDALKLYPQAVEVTPEMSYRTRHLLSSHNFRCIVAPFEADGQLAAGCRLGSWWAVISEDSDILVMGAPRLITKFRQGSGEMYTFKNVVKDLTAQNGLAERGLPSDTPWRGSLAPAHFSLGCILGGCDYVNNIGGIGLRRAFKFLRDARGSLSRLLKLILLEGYTIQPEYENQLKYALWGFYCQVALHPETNQLCFFLAKSDWTEHESNFFIPWCADECPSNSFKKIMERLRLSETKGLLPWSEYLNGDDNLFHDLAFQFGLSIDQENDNDMTNTTLRKNLLDFSLNGKLHPATFKKFRDVIDSTFQDHPIILRSSKSPEKLNKKPKHVNSNKSGAPPPSPAGPTLNDFFGKANKTTESPRETQIEPLTARTLAMHNKNLQRSDETIEMRILRLLNEVSRPCKETRIVPDLSGLEDVEKDSEHKQCNPNSTPIMTPGPTSPEPDENPLLSKTPHNLDSIIKAKQDNFHIDEADKIHAPKQNETMKTAEDISAIYANESEKIATKAESNPPKHHKLFASPKLHTPVAPKRTRNWPTSAYIGATNQTTDALTDNREPKRRRLLTRDTSSIAKRKSTKSEEIGLLSLLERDSCEKISRPRQPGSTKKISIDHVNLFTADNHNKSRNTHQPAQSHLNLFKAHGAVATPIVGTSDMAVHQSKTQQSLAGNFSDWLYDDT